MYEVGAWIPSEMNTWGAYSDLSTVIRCEMNQQLKVENKTKKRICSEVSVNSPGIHVVSPEIEKEGYGGKDLRKRKVLSLE